MQGLCYNPALILRSEALCSLKTAEDQVLHKAVKDTSEKETGKLHLDPLRDSIFEFL